MDSSALHVDPIEALWQLGDLDYFLHEGQLDMRNGWHAHAGRRFVVCCSRRYGKSFWLVVEAVECAVNVDNAIVLIAAPTAKMVRTIVEPHMRRVLKDAPASMQPKYSRMEGVWRFPNGSEVRAAGCDSGNAERLRGAECHLALVDEAGFIDELDYVVQDVLLPQTLTTGGRILMASTPPITPAHPFQQYCAEAEAAGHYIHRTIHDAPHLTPELIAEYAEESGGEDTSTWRREYLAQFVVDEARAVVPEFSRYEDELVGEAETPSHYHAYVAMDVGYHDMTVALLAYWHFDRAKLVIQAEVALQRATSDVIDGAVADLERALWSNRETPVYHPRGVPVWEPVARVVDAPELVVADLRRLHGRPWREARKDDKDAALNALRLGVARKQLLIDPQCKTLIAHLRHAIWNKSRTSYERIETDRERHHFDAVDALVYLWRHVDRNRNPYPALMRGETPESHWIRKSAEDRRQTAQVKRMFRRKWKG